MDVQKISFDLELANSIFKANLISLINVSIDNIEAQKKQYEALIQGLSDGNEDNDWLDKNSHYSNVEWILLNSILLSSFSFFEHHLFKLCRIIEDKNISKIQVQDISGKGIIKFCNYLFLVGEIQGANRSIKEWQEINYFQKVRNLIAHNGGIMISDPSKKLENHECYNFLTKYNVVMAGTLGHIRIRNLDFIESFKNLTVNISDNLTKEISTRFF